MSALYAYISFRRVLYNECRDPGASWCRSFGNRWLADHQSDGHYPGGQAMGGLGALQHDVFGPSHLNTLILDDLQFHCDCTDMMVA